MGAVEAVAPGTFAGWVGWEFPAVVVGTAIVAEGGLVTARVGETVAVGSPGVDAMLGSSSLGATDAVSDVGAMLGSSGVGATDRVRSAAVVVRTGSVGQVVGGIIDGEGDADATGVDGSVGAWLAGGAVQTDGDSVVVGAWLAGGAVQTDGGGAVVGAWLAGGVAGSMTADGGGAVVGA